jgi:hypothetical protein
MKNELLTQIEVECMEGYDIVSQDGKQIFAVVDEGIYTGILNEESREYFAKDRQGNDFLIGELDVDDNLRLEDGFRLKGSNEIAVLDYTDELGTHTLMNHDYCIKCDKCEKERLMTEDEIIDNKIKPHKCECGGENHFHYWLDGIYSESEYNELVRKAGFAK